jgi:hypothetical protein
MTDLIRIDIEGSKYTVRQKKAGDLEILRYGEPWMSDSIKGSKMILAMAYELEELRELKAKGEAHATKVGAHLDEMALILGAEDGYEDADVLIYANKKLSEAAETYTDRHGTVWTRPTAWAYFAACRALKHHNDMLRSFRPDVQRFRDFTRRIESMRDDMVLTAGSSMAARQLTVKDFKNIMEFFAILESKVPTRSDEEWDEAQRQAKIAMTEDPGSDEELGINSKTLGDTT